MRKSQSTLKYFLSAVVDILHTCVYLELISLPADIANRITVHGSRQHHKSIVDLTFITIS
jgi:hypothetical protein